MNCTIFLFFLSSVLSYASVCTVRLLLLFKFFVNTREVMQFTHLPCPMVIEDNEVKMILFIWQTLPKNKNKQTTLPGVSRKSSFSKAVVCNTSILYVCLLETFSFKFDYIKTMLLKIIFDIS